MPSHSIPIVMTCARATAAGAGHQMPTNTHTYMPGRHSGTLVHHRRIACPLSKQKCTPTKGTKKKVTDLFSFEAKKIKTACQNVGDAGKIQFSSVTYAFVTLMLVGVWLGLLWGIILFLRSLYSKFRLKYEPAARLAQLQVGMNCLENVPGSGALCICPT